MNHLQQFVPSKSDKLLAVEPRGRVTRLLGLQIKPGKLLLQVLSTSSIRAQSRASHFHECCRGRRRLLPSGLGDAL